MEVISQRQYVSCDWLRRMKKLLSSFETQLKDGKAMLLRVGRHSGAEAVTLNGVRTIKIMQGKGKPPKYEPSPQTLWLASEAEASPSEMTPFGWLLVEIDPTDKALPMLEDLTRETIDTRQKWLAEQQLRITRLREELTRSKQEEDARKQAHIAERQAEEERQERIASMTAEQRAVYELRELFETAQDNGTLAPQGQVPGRLWELMKTAVDWPRKDRIELCDLAEEIYKPLGMLRGKKGKGRKESIEKLRE